MMAARSRGGYQYGMIPLKKRLTGDLSRCYNAASCSCHESARRRESL